MNNSVIMLFSLQTHTWFQQWDTQPSALLIPLLSLEAAEKNLLKNDHFHFHPSFPMLLIFKGGGKTAHNSITESVIVLLPPVLPCEVCEFVCVWGIWVCEPSEAAPFYTWPPLGPHWPEWSSGTLTSDERRTCSPTTGRATGRGKLCHPSITPRPLRGCHHLHRLAHQRNVNARGPQTQTNCKHKRGWILGESFCGWFPSVFAMVVGVFGGMGLRNAGPIARSHLSDTRAISALCRLRSGTVITHGGADMPLSHLLCPPSISLSVHMMNWQHIMGNSWNGL